MKVWVRTCQECGHVQTARSPDEMKNKKPSDAYLNSLCKRCKSEGLDYGSWWDFSRFEQERNR